MQLGPVGAANTTTEPSKSSKKEGKKKRRKSSDAAPGEKEGGLSLETITNLQDQPAKTQLTVAACVAFVISNMDKVRKSVHVCGTHDRH